MIPIIGSQFWKEAQSSNYLCFILKVTNLILLIFNYLLLCEVLVLFLYNLSNLGKVKFTITMYSIILAGVVLFPGAMLPLRVIQHRFICSFEKAMSNNEARCTVGVVLSQLLPFLNAQNDFPFLIEKRNLSCSSFMGNSVCVCWGGGRGGGLGIL